MPWFIFHEVPKLSIYHHSSKIGQFLSRKMKSKKKICLNFFYNHYTSWCHFHVASNTLHIPQIICVNGIKVETIFLQVGMIINNNSNARRVVSSDRESVRTVPRESVRRIGPQQPLLQQQQQQQPIGRRVMPGRRGSSVDGLESSFSESEAGLNGEVDQVTLFFLTFFNIFQFLHFPMYYTLHVTLTEMLLFLHIIITTTTYAILTFYLKNLF